MTFSQYLALLFLVCSKCQPYICRPCTTFFVHSYYVCLLLSILDCTYFCQNHFLLASSKSLFQIVTKNMSCWPGYAYINYSPSYTNINNNNGNGNVLDKFTVGSVVNISDITLSETELSLLSQGLNFCPTPGEPDFSEVKQDLDKFHTSLRRKDFFIRRDIVRWI